MSRDPVLELLDRIHYATEVEQTDPEDPYLQNRARAIRRDVVMQTNLLIAAELTNIANALTRLALTTESINHALDHDT